MTSDLITLLRRGWIPLVALAVVGATLGALTSIARHPTFEATSQVYVSSGSANSISDVSAASTFAQNAVASYADVARTSYVLGPAARSVGISYSSQLADDITVNVPASSTVLSISATRPTGADAAKLANAVADELVAAVTRLTPSADGRIPVRLTQVEPARAPSVPSGPGLAVWIALGGVLGVILAVGLLIGREFLDTRIRTEQEYQAMMIGPVLGRTLYNPDAREHPIVTRSNQDSLDAETYYAIRASLRYISVDSQLDSLVVTSSIESEGKSTFVANLAVALASSGRRVLVVDADLRRSTLASLFGLEPSTGLSELISGEVLMDAAIQHTGESGLDVLPAGSIPPNPSELMESAAMAELVEVFRETYDVVLFDAPPLVPVVDAASLAASCSGVVFVNALGRVRKQSLQLARERLDRMKVTVLGSVFTMLPRRDLKALGVNYYYK